MTKRRPATTEWGDYVVLDLPFGPIPPNELSRKHARESFAGLMEMRPHRIEALRRLVARNGFPANTKEELIGSVADFVNAHAEADPDPLDLGVDFGRQFHLPLPVWQGVALDIGLLRGTAMIDALPRLRWELQTRGGKLMDGYHYPVVTGFTKGPWPNFYINPIGLALGEMEVAVADDDDVMDPLATAIEDARPYV